MSDLLTTTMDSDSPHLTGCWNCAYNGIFKNWNKSIVCNAKKTINYNKEASCTHLWL